MDVKKRALAFSEALAKAHVAVDATGDEAARTALDEVHEHARLMLYQHGCAVGLTKGDIAQIDNNGQMIRGGEPKTDPTVAEA